MWAVEEVNDFALSRFFVPSGKYAFKHEAVGGVRRMKWDELINQDYASTAATTRSGSFIRAPSTDHEADLLLIFALPTNSGESNILILIVMLLASLNQYSCNAARGRYVDVL